MHSLARFCFLCLEGRKIHNILFSVKNEDEDGTVLEEKLKCLFSEFQYFKPEITKYICNICIIEMNNFYKFRRKCLSSFTTICRYLGQLSEKEEEYKNLSIYLQDIKNNKLQQDLSIKGNEIVEILECKNVSILLEDLKFNKNLQYVIDGRNSISTSKELVVKTEELETLFHENEELDLLPICQSNELSPHQIKKENLENKLSESNRINTNEENIKVKDLGLLSGLKTDDLNLLPIYLNKEESFSPSHQTMEEDLEENLIEDHTEIVEDQEELESIPRVNISEKMFQINIQLFDQNESNVTSNSSLVVEESNKSKEEHSRIFCVLCDKTFANSKNLMKHVDQHSDILQCKICDLFFPTKKQMYYHVKTHNHSRNPFVCSYCQLSFTKTRDLYTHTRKKHKDSINCVKPDVYVEEENNSSDNETRGKYKCPLCTKTFANLPNLRRHKLTHTLEKPFKCRLCDYRCSDAGYLVIHMRRHTGEKPYKCDHCRKTFSTSSYLAKHTRSLHKAVYTYRVKPALNKEPAVVCKYCRKRFSSLGNLKKHVQSVHLKETESSKIVEENSSNENKLNETLARVCFRCKSCDLEFPLAEQLDEHVKTEHCFDNTSNPFDCSNCTLSFYKIGDLYLHTQTEHQSISNFPKEQVCVKEENDLSGEYKCQICIKIFSSLRSLQLHKLIHASEVHMRKHTGEKPYKCEFCQRTYSSSDSLIRHKRLSHKISPVLKKVKQDKQPVCKYCLQVFSSSNDLEKHLIDIHSVKSSTIVEESQETSSTDIEEKSSNQSELNETVDVVDSLRCEFCNIDFSFKEELDYHFKTDHCRNNTSNPFVCMYCELSFAKTGDLFIHTQKAHKDCFKILKPAGRVVEENKSDKKTKNACKICMKTYSTPKNLRRHELTHASEKPFKCKFCSYRCSVPAYLEIHMRRHTGEKRLRCDYCKKTFATSSYLVRHKRIIHKVKPKPNLHAGPPVCKYCQKELSTFGRLKRHLKTVHSRINSVVDEIQQNETDDYSNTEPIIDVLEIDENKTEMKIENICLDDENEFIEDSLLSTSTSMEFSEENIKTESTPASTVFKGEIVYGSGIQFAIMQPLQQEQYILPDL